MNKYKKINELIVEYPKSEDDPLPPGNFRTFYLEYESDLEIGGNHFASFYGVQMIVEMRTQ